MSIILGACLEFLYTNLSYATLSKNVMSLMFRIVFWDVLPCKIIVDLLFYTAVHPRRQF
jgi:hypothetical protein